MPSLEYTSLQKNVASSVSSSSWYQLESISDVNTSTPGLPYDLSTGLITPTATGLYRLAAYVRWPNGGDDYSGVRSIRFVRDPEGTPDSTGHSDVMANTGNTYQSTSWMNKLSAGTPMAVEIFQNSGGTLSPSLIQFKIGLIELA